MRAALLSIGDELTLGANVDTNSAWLARALADRSIRVVEHRTVEDHRAHIAAALAQLAAAYELLIVTGGLGPTDDDLTRFALADVTDPGVDLVTDDVALRQVERWFRNRPMPDANRVQAVRPASARCLENRRGTAPGLAAEHDGCRIYVLPGPPHEMHAMFEARVVPDLPVIDADALIARTVHACGLGESHGAERLGKLTERGRTPEIGTTASRGVVTAHVRAWGRRDEVGPAVDRDVESIHAAWQPYAFGLDGETLPEVVGRLLEDAGRTLATAESCTGGWLGKQIVDVANASAYYSGGWVTYSNELKRTCLGVPESTLAEHGAVSEPVARAMATGARVAADAGVAVAVTGLAGPAGGTESKPVGTVFIAVEVRDTDEPDASVRRFRFSGDRTIVRERSCLAALQMVRFALLGVPRETPLLGEVTECLAR